MIKEKTGFTLIELLVVVLIIGILAAIAVPQYQKSVEKAKLTEAVINTRAFAAAVERYRLQTGGSNPTSLDDLDLELPNTTRINAAQMANDYFVYYIDPTNNTFVARRKFSPTDNTIATYVSIGYWFAQDPRTTSSALGPNSLICAVQIGSAKESFYTGICKSMGATITNYVDVQGYRHYRLN